MRELTGADYALLAQPDDLELPRADVTTLVVNVCSGMAGDSLIGREIPVERSTCGAAFRDSSPRRTMRLEYDLAAGTGEQLGPAIVLPLRASSDAVSGILVALRGPDGSPFRADQVAFASAFADQAALALQLADDQRRLHTLELFGDRDRIARELHDHVIQRLFAHGLALQSTHQRTRSPETQQRLADMIEDVQNVIGEIRTAIFDLHGGLEGTDRLRKRLNEIIAELTASTGAHLRTTVRMSGPLGVVSDALGEHAEAVLREALSNVVHHASAGTVTITISADDNLAIEVIDNGAGLPAGVARSGLHNLRERAEQAEGTFSVEAPPSGGTRLFWSAPVG
jgi:signal transduction histidine kinase